MHVDSFSDASTYSTHQDVPRNTPYSHDNIPLQIQSIPAKSHMQRRQGSRSRNAMRRHYERKGSVQKWCAEMKTREMLTTILTDGITLWFNDNLLQPADYPTPFHQLLHQQNNIGWRQLFHGRCWMNTRTQVKRTQIENPDAFIQLNTEYD
jgi:hypothetical protein